MGISQTKRWVAFDNIIGANAQQSTTVTAKEPCNVHGLILDVFVGQTGAGLSFGYWMLLLMPRPAAAVSEPIINTTNLNLELENPLTWMLGSWMTDDAGVVSHVGGAPKSSRNCPRDSRLILIIQNSALSGSSIRTHGIMTWFETIK